jgi:rare lipoprotein A
MSVALLPRPRLTALGLGLLLLSTGCVHARARPAAPAAEEEEGLAGYYAPQFEGRQTASGALFHHEALTCAHRTLPFGTVVEVERVDDGRSVRVTVTDRGPFVHARIVDLTLRAARELGLVKQGLARVRLRVVGQASGAR